MKEGSIQSSVFSVQCADLAAQMHGFIQRAEKAGLTREEILTLLCLVMRGDSGATTKDIQYLRPSCGNRASSLLNSLFENGYATKSKALPPCSPGVPIMTYTATAKAHALLIPQN